MDCSQPGFCPWGFSKQDYWSELPCPPPEDLPRSSQGSNPGLLHYRWILYQRSSQESPQRYTELIKTLPQGSSESCIFSDLIGLQIQEKKAYEFTVKQDSFQIKWPGINHLTTTWQLQGSSMCSLSKAAWMLPGKCHLTRSGKQQA